MEFAKHFNKFVFRPTRATIFAIVAALNTGVPMATVFSAYGGIFDPGKVVIAALMARMIPGFI
ncbi:MAG: hypothetical protein K2H88_07370, partial [Duncaniella sp.]|nr:hypothetical protein [Duncaniella sp.]